MFYPNKKFLDEIDSIPDVPALCVVPWIKSEVVPWIQTHDSLPINGEKEYQPSLIENGVVVEALKTLKAVVNVRTGLSHPSDRESTVQIFSKLRDAGEFYNPDDVKAWLIRNGWSATEAQDIAELSQKVLDKRPLRKGRSKFRRGLVNRWRKAAADKGESTS